MDVWWMVHDGGLLLMIAHLLLRHETCVGRVQAVRLTCWWRSTARQLETPDALKLRHQRRLILLADGAVQANGIVRHASLSSIFDMSGISAPVATPPRPEHDHNRAVGDAGAAGGGGDGRGDW